MEIRETLKKGLQEGPRDLTGTELGVALLRALADHPEAGTKIGVGVDHFEVRAGRKGHPTYVVVRVDGTHDSFSYVRCLGVNESPAARLKRVARTCIYYQIGSFRDAALRAGHVCGLSGAPVTAADAEVHHTGREFHELWDGFLDTEGLDWRGIEIADDRIKDYRIVTRWRSYHAVHARLILVSREAHRAHHNPNPSLVPKDLRRDEDYLERLRVKSFIRVFGPGLEVRSDVSAGAAHDAGPDRGA